MKGEKAVKALKELGGVATQQNVIHKIKPSGSFPERAKKQIKDAINAGKILTMLGITIGKRGAKHPTLYLYFPKREIHREYSEYSELKGGSAKMNILIQRISGYQNEEKHELKGDIIELKKAAETKENNMHYADIKSNATVSILPRIIKELKKHGRCRTIEKKNRGEIIVQTSES